jgi:hypothetical protein
MVQPVDPTPRLTRRELLLVSLLFGVVISAFLSGAMFTGRYLSPSDLLFRYQPWSASKPSGWSTPTNGLISDSTLAFEPWREYGARQIRQGRLPLWNPDNMLGAPFAANIQAGIYYPGNWLYYLWPDGNIYWVQAWLKLFLAALGMYLLARQVLGVGPLGAIIGALTYTFSAYMVVWLLFPLADAGVWLPWLVWATARLVTAPTPGKAGVLAVMSALSILAGHPETAFHNALVVGAFAVFMALRAGPRRLDRVVRVLLVWAGAYALGAVVSAVQLLPFAEYLLNSAMLRARSGGAESAPLPAYYMWLFFSPRLFGTPVAPANWWGPVLNYNEVNGYFGVLTCLLAPFAAFARRPGQRAMALFLLALAVVCMGIAFGWPVFRQIAEATPVLKLARNGRLTYAVGFAVALLAALGVEVLWQAYLHRRLKLALVLIAGFVTLMVVGFLLPWANPGGLFPPPPDVEVWRGALARSAWLIELTAAIVLVAIILAAWRPSRPQLTRAVLGLLPLVLLLDMWDAHAGYNPTVRPAEYFPQVPETRFLQEQQGLHRFFASLRVMPPNTNLMYGLSDFQGYDALMPYRYQQVASQIDPIIDVPVTGRVGNLQSPLINLLNVRYLLIPPEDDWNRMIEDPRQMEHGEAESTVGPIGGARKVGQTFLARHNGLSRISVLGATYAKQPVGRLIFHLRASPSDNVDIATVQKEPGQLENNSYWDFDFPAVAQSAGRNFYFYIEAPDEPPGGAITSYFSPEDLYPEGTRVEDGKPINGDLTFVAASSMEAENAWLNVAVDGGGDRTTILQNRRALPRAWMAHTAQFISDADLRLKRLQDPDLDYASTAVLEEPLPPDLPLAVPLPAQTDVVEITHYEPEQVSINTRSGGAGLLVLADQAFPGWTAYVDGKPTPIFTAYHTLRAVYVPAGEHTVRFEYRPLSFALGALYSALGLLGVVALFLWPRLRARRAIRDVSTPDAA